MNLLIAVFLRACTQATDISHEAVQGLLSLANKLVKIFKFGLFDVVQYFCINQMGKSFIQFAAGNGILMEAVQIVITPISFGEIRGDTL